MSFDEQPDVDPHGECALEIAHLEARIQKVRDFLRDQWSRIPAVPHAQPGSYDRGYQNGIGDVLRGLQVAITTCSTSDATSEPVPPGRPAAVEGDTELVQYPV
jgi:hypothetical protein